MTFMLNGRIGTAADQSHQDAFVIVGIINFVDERVEFDGLENDFDAELLQIGLISTAVFSRELFPMLVLNTNSIRLPSASYKVPSPLRSSMPISFNSPRALARSCGYGRMFGLNHFILPGVSKP